MADGVPAEEPQKYLIAVDQKVTPEGKVRGLFVQFVTVELPEAEWDVTTFTLLPPDKRETQLLRNLIGGLPIKRDV